MSNQDWKVVIVEDTYDDLQVMLTIFEHYEIPVWGAQSGAELQQLLAEFTPTLVITDLAMPDNDGWDVLHHIRSHSMETHIPVVAMTSYHSDRLAAEVWDGGFDGYFPKPIEPLSFIEELERIVKA